MEKITNLKQQIKKSKTEGPVEAVSSLTSWCLGNRLNQSHGSLPHAPLPQLPHPSGAKEGQYPRKEGTDEDSQHLCKTNS